MIPRIVTLCFLLLLAMSGCESAERKAERQGMVNLTNAFTAKQFADLLSLAEQQQFSNSARRDSAAHLVVLAQDSLIERSRVEKDRILSTIKQMPSSDITGKMNAYERLMKLDPENSEFRAARDLLRKERAWHLAAQREERDRHLTAQREERDRHLTAEALLRAPAILTELRRISEQGRQMEGVRRSSPSQCGVQMRSNHAQLDRIKSEVDGWPQTLRVLFAMPISSTRQCTSCSDFVSEMCRDAREIIPEVEAALRRLR